MSGGLVIGMKVLYVARRDWGVGHLISYDPEAGRAAILFPEQDEPLIVSTRGGGLERHVFEPGDLVRLDGEDAPFAVLEVLPGEGGSPRARYRVAGRRHPAEEEPDGLWEHLLVDEAAIRAVPPSPDALDSLRAGRVGDARSFLLRREALRLDDERRADALGALFASRVMPLPHQVGVVQRALSAERPRFVLADEVGLGKTIEAGMIFSALRLAGLASRVLVIAPSHLTVQWLVELSHKFNRLFTLMDKDRHARERELLAGSPWAGHDLVVTSLELLSRDERHRAEVGAKEAAWDLVIIDEAHHLRARRAFEVAEAVAGNTWGLLLLTATPMQLDPEEYGLLLKLIDPDAAPSLDALKERIQRQEEISAAARALLAGDEPEGALSELASRFPDDPVLAEAYDGPADRLRQRGRTKELLGHLAETYSLSEHLIRNRRATVGGFTGRNLNRLRFTVPPPERELRDAVIGRLGEAKHLRGAVLSRLLRALESSPAALRRALERHKELSSILDERHVPDADEKARVFLELLGRVQADEPGAKVLVFTESRVTLDWLVTLLGREGVLALGYHGDLGLVDRDRRVARFRDPDGPRVLVSTEVGGEGRNFQFCHHLINYDLPWSPAAMEQRIGRLDRIGQTQPVRIWVLEPEGTLSAEVVTLLDESVGVFQETVGGLDAVLEEVEPRLLELALRPREERERFAREVAEKVGAARSQAQRAYDPLLDLRSADMPGVSALAGRASRRLGLSGDGDEADTERTSDHAIRDALWGVARDLDERLEETITEIAARIGIGVDLDEQVDAFQCAFHLGHALKVDALPGLDITEERTILGTFWRDTAIDHEEIDYFATGHPLIEALLGFLRDGPFGRAAFRLLRAPHGKLGTSPVRGLELLFHLEDSRALDAEVGARQPARQISRFLDERLVRVIVTLEGDGSLRVHRAGAGGLEGALASLLDDGGGETLRGDEISRVFPGFGGFVTRAAAAAESAAEATLVERVGRARALVDAERDRRLARLELSLTHQDVPRDARVVRRLALAAHHARLHEALDSLRPVLDSASGFAAR